MLYRSFLLKLSTFIDKDPSWDGFAQFKIDVIDKFQNKEELPKEYHINEENWNSSIIQYLTDDVLEFPIDRNLFLSLNSNNPRNDSNEIDKKNCLLL